MESTASRENGVAVAVLFLAARPSCLPDYDFSRLRFSRLSFDLDRLRWRLGDRLRRGDRRGDLERFLRGLLDRDLLLDRRP